MNFTPDMLEKVLNGTKTQTRRPVKEGETLVRRWYCLSKPSVPAVNTSTNRKKWMVTDDVAICPGRGRKAVGRVVIKNIRKERAIDITEEDARAEGFDSREAFFDKLRSLYGSNVDLTAPYWALTFELVAREKEAQS